jgi:hypothetical protein
MAKSDKKTILPTSRTYERGKIRDLVRVPMKNW